MEEERCRRFEYGLREARDEDGFPIMQKNLDGTESTVKEYEWGKKLSPVSIFYCSKCNKPTKNEAPISHRWDIKFWHDFFASDKCKRTKFCLIDGKLYCENCIPPMRDIHLHNLVDEKEYVNEYESVDLDDDSIIGSAAEDRRYFDKLKEDHPWI